MTATAQGTAAGSRSATYSAVTLAQILGQHSPTDEQIEVIEAPMRPGAIVAGAGSGKTETMAARVVWLVANGFVEPGKVLGLTFTRKAASELSSRIRDRLRTLAMSTAGRIEPDEAWLQTEPTVLTYDAYARRLVTEHGLRLGVEPSTGLADAGTLWLLAYQVVSASDAGLEALDVTLRTVVGWMQQLGDELLSHVRSLEDLDDYCEQNATHLESLPKKLGKSTGKLTDETLKVARALRSRQLLIPLLKEFARAKAEREVMSFGDVMKVGCELVEKFPDIGDVERGRYDAVLLDEYQDTSHAQARFLSRLYAGHPITAVGDPCQAIYAFRGASDDTLASFGHVFGVGEAVTTHQLSMSFRNQESILGLANGVSAPLRERGAEVAQLTAPSGTADGAVSVAFYDDVYAEADAVAARAEQLRTADEAAGTSSSVAVLCRARSQFTPMIKALQAREVPYEVVGLSGLISVPEVADIVAVLRVLDQPDASADLLRILTGPRVRLGSRDLDRLAKLAGRLSGRRADSAREGATDTPVESDDVDERSIVEALDSIGDAPTDWFSTDGHQRLTRLAGELRMLRGSLALPLGDLVTLVERTINLDVEVAVRDRRRGAQPGAQLDAFVSVATGFSSDAGTNSLSAFVRYLHAAEEEDRGLALAGVETRSDAVQILTVHAAKGLEWDVVFVPGLVTKKFPASPDPVEGWLTAPKMLPYALRGDVRAQPGIDITGCVDEVEFKEERARYKDAVADKSALEERRLFYVAATRARSQLHLSGGTWDEALKPRAPSEFLIESKELGPSIGATTPVWADEPAPDARNPLHADDHAEQWPPQRPLGHFDRLEAAAAHVRALTDCVHPGPSQGGADEGAPPDERADQMLRDTELLLTDRRARRTATDIEIPMPQRLSASQMVALHTDATQFALDIRRPLPRGPQRSASRGTAFHAWLEQRFGSRALLDLDDLPGSGDEDVMLDESYDDLIAAFERSEWADRQPHEVEVPFDISIGGTPVRGRLDAVFACPPGGRYDYDVIDWKTGRRPVGEQLAHAEVQLAVYRIAWARVAGVPVERVSAGFHYVADGTTHRPQSLLREDELADLLSADPAS
ncbi:DNA helicase-2/ATP-dependent DNA helicase PcrA [Antricoccus suffuscus]|uniref:DNA 3'-5' helicase n=1 Tax=Antricoccus suffuscus TaxID=1629062 RepID=A0A2T0ZQC2_9ACTN|nr:ATP-dependent DNA helicase [Antricoccus suffuscus]PRZ38552.1 DNA helicase-2/ATP-dependent DNA helicase PcrA [Antricoccus suffuscus]